MKRIGRLLFTLTFYGLCAVRSMPAEVGTNFYVDPDWPGAQNGTARRPWRTLGKAAWNSINAALANSDVTIYFSALKANGTQQSAARFIQCRRTDPGSNRLTLDGYSEYNSNETNPSWLSNSDTDINHAYLNGKVFKTTGDGSQALGWNRPDGNDFVTHNGLVYCCIESHLASPDTEPGRGARWQLYWDQHGLGGTEWSAGNSYKCYPKQDNITLRGFELTGNAARAGAAGDNLIFEYIYVHDTTGIGPGLQILYTSFPDSSAAQIISRPSTNMVFRNFRVERTYGEGFYLGSINPDAPGSFQLAHGNQHDHILIENFLISHPGVNGGQGDAIDCKNGITNLTIRLGEITGFGNNGNGINVPLTATNINQNTLIERNFIHDALMDNLGAQRAIYAGTGDGTEASLYGINGVTIRNNIIANCLGGVIFSGSANPDPVQPATYGHIYNNTTYNAGYYVLTNIANTVVENNFVFGGSDPRGTINPSGVTSDYNAHDGQWVSANEGAHTLALNTAQALSSVVNVTNENFHLVFGAPLIGRAEPQDSFSDDFDGAARGLLWDIGAYHFASTATPTPTPFPTSTPTAIPTATPSAPTSILSNISTRSFVQTDNVIIGGFIIEGTEPKRVIVRAIGPELTQFGVTNALVDPTLELHDGTTALIASNDSWQHTIIRGIISADQVGDIINSGRAPKDARESAMVVTLPPGNYTAIVRGKNNTAGVALVEVYTFNPGTSSIFANISTRGFVQTGDNVIIGGFIIEGTEPKRVIVRAIGPELTQFGVTNALADPTLELHDGTMALIASNDSWQHTIIRGIISADQVGDIINSGRAPKDARESAMVVTLPPGNYTATVRGLNNTSGVGLVEVYDLD